MGNQQTTFSQDQLDRYQDCTYFTASEILRLHKKFRQLSPELVPTDMTGNKCTDVLLPASLVEGMPELKDNPFADRIVRVFSDGTSLVNFENFLCMFSAFSEQAPCEVKAFYAFRIYDADEDQFLNENDLVWTLQRLTGGHLNKEEIDLVVKKVLEEAEMDDDARISFMEFEHVIYRSPDFLSTFHIRI
ncbi:calcium and integrin-binding family member 2-like isoform X1 [Clavelina lepadiformis]|uniref:calcium and integrin-binding family member 2-like isoform X1 n=1 Tax=Clavelina lepadiformis TaxID=159417 RepID=UPI00404272E3